MVGDFANMGNQSLSYLEGNNIPINCSVYSLTNGSLSLQLIGDDNQTWTNATKNFLPAYYITNCSIPRLIELVDQSDVVANGTRTKYADSLYNENDNGDIFVASLFIICGSCVSCWMLSLLLYLSPRHKRKPLLTQLSTVFYSVVTTILLSRLTQVSRQQYYDDMLDIVKLNQFVYDFTVYKVTIVLSRLFTALAWYQIALKISRQKYKWLTAIAGALLITAHMVAQIYYQIAFNNSITNSNDTLAGSYRSWKIARATLQLLVLIWFSANILGYTTMIKNPRKVCYSRRLLPLAIFNWFLMILNAILTILYISLFRDNWLVKTWLGLVPYLLDVILLTTVWEWIYKIWVLEKRFELMGVLGRKMSTDEGMSINSDDVGRNKLVLQPKNKLFSMIERVFCKGSNRIVEEGSIKSVELDVLSTKDSSPSSRDQSQNQQRSIHSHKQRHLHNQVNLFATDETHAHTRTDIHESSPAIIDDDSDGDYEDEIVDDYEIWGREEDDDNSAENIIIGSSNQFETGGNDESDEPPPFQPLPGFSEDDYWNDDKR
ncbi:pH-response regulator protein palH/RIM21 [Spathaspora sp. JA1]|nr:pH-response regulator protein palH/RIM21 [Spathaspora sp. JA1]